MRMLSWMVLATLCALVGCSRGDSNGTNLGDDGPTEAQCMDARDDDGDGLVDCADPDCAGERCVVGRRAFCGGGQCGGGEQGGECSDGLDNDLDGVSDCEDVDCSGTCACGECAEQCGDGVDDDGDGSVDEGCPCAFGNLSQGVCAMGQVTATGLCAQPSGYQPTELACDGVDNDCDGSIDEGCLCSFSGASEGVCLFARRDISGSCTRPSLYQDDELLCDGFDNDCDGEVDEGCQLCDFGGFSVGACVFGRPGMTAGDCFAPAAHQLVETLCDGVDNDCDGSIDEGCPCFFDDAGFGACLLGRTDDAGTCVEPQRFEQDETSCDGQDNDCDGTIDEGCELCVALDRPVGVCLFGVSLLGDGGERSCQPPGSYEPDEVSCDDGLDNDCDGFADDEDPECLTEKCMQGLDLDRDGAIGCDDTDCADEPECAQVVFTTRRAYDGDLGGPEGADWLCQQEARAAGRVGVFRGVLAGPRGVDASETVGPGERLRLAGPVFDVTGRRVSRSAAELFGTSSPGARAAYGGLAVDAFGVAVPSPEFVWTGSMAGFATSSSPRLVWTGTRSDGLASDTCGDWSGWAEPALGRQGKVDEEDARTRGCTTGCTEYLDAGPSAVCAASARLMCLSGQVPEDCALPGDQDGDGAPDELDPECQAPALVEVCADAYDNDEDGLFGCDDPDCAGKECAHVAFVALSQGLFREADDSDARCRRAAAQGGLVGSFRALPSAAMFRAQGAQADMIAAARAELVETRGPVRAVGPAGRVLARSRAELLANIDAIVVGDGAYSASGEVVPRSLGSDGSSVPELRTVRLLCVGGQTP